MLNRVIERSRLAVKLVSRRNLDFMEMLEIDHICVEMYYFLFEWSDNFEESRTLIGAIKEQLLKHRAVAEAFVFPACERIPELKERIEDCREEHRHLKALLHQLKTFGQDAEKTKSLMKAVMAAVRYHVQEEETQLFPRIRQLMNKEQIQRITDLVKRAKQERKKRYDERLAA